MIKEVVISDYSIKHSVEVPMHQIQINYLHEKIPLYMKYIKMKCKQYQNQDKKKFRCPMYLYKCHYESNNRISSNEIQDISNLPTFTQNVYEILRESNLKCFYCQNNVYIEYTHVNRMQQWTLDRIDNNKNHDVKNCVIACLSCNLKRRNINATKYKFTKQLKLEKDNN